MKYTAIIAYCLIILISCVDNNRHLGAYAIESQGATDRYIILNKKNGGMITQYYSDTVFDSSFVSFYGKVIPSYINEYESNDRFIIVIQKPLDSICECNESCFKHMNSYDSKSYSRCKIALDKSNIKKYWIIDKKHDLIYGPLSKDAFLLKRTKLDIPNSLNFKNEK